MNHSFAELGLRNLCQLVLEFDLARMKEYIYETNLNDLWSLLKRTVEVPAIITAITSSFIVSEASLSEIPKITKKTSTLLLASKFSIKAFAVNQVNNRSLVLEIPHLLYEIDTEQSRRFFADENAPKLDDYDEEHMNAAALESSNEKKDKAELPVTIRRNFSRSNRGIAGLT